MALHEMQMYRGERNFAPQKHIGFAQELQNSVSLFYVWALSIERNVALWSTEYDQRNTVWRAKPKSPGISNTLDI